MDPSYYWSSLHHGSTMDHHGSTMDHTICHHGSITCSHPPLISSNPSLLSHPLAPFLTFFLPTLCCSPPPSFAAPGPWYSNCSGPAGGESYLGYDRLGASPVACTPKDAVSLTGSPPSRNASDSVQLMSREPHPSYLQHVLVKHTCLIYIRILINMVPTSQL